MSLIPRGGHKSAPNPALMETMPQVYISMGLTAENVVKEYGISRQQQDEFSYGSHKKALAAQEAGNFDDELVPLDVEFVHADNGTAQDSQTSLRERRGCSRGHEYRKTGSAQAGFSCKWHGNRG